MSLAVLAAMAEGRVIGKDNALPWRLPADLQRFKRLTMGHPLIMGRRTWESLPRKPLPGRLNIVVTRQEGYPLPEGAVRAASLAEAEALAGAGAFVIGGAALFAEALPRAGRLHLTQIHRAFAGDVFFPEWDRRAWRETGREKGRSDEGWDYEFIDYERNA